MLIDHMETKNKTVITRACKAMREGTTFFVTVKRHNGVQHWRGQITTITSLGSKLEDGWRLTVLREDV